MCTYIRVFSVDNDTLTNHEQITTDCAAHTRCFNSVNCVNLGESSLEAS